MKTHKNPELRKHHVPVPYTPKTAAFKPMGKAATQAPAKPPKLALEGKKWVVVSKVQSENVSEILILNPKLEGLESIKIAYHSYTAVLIGVYFHVLGWKVSLY